MYNKYIVSFPILFADALLSLVGLRRAAMSTHSLFPPKDDDDVSEDRGERERKRDSAFFDFH